MAPTPGVFSHYVVAHQCPRFHRLGDRDWELFNKFCLELPCLQKFPYGKYCLPWQIESMQIWTTLVIFMWPPTLSVQRGIQYPFSIKRLKVTLVLMQLLVSERKLSVMHSLRLSGESLCQNFLVHPRCTLGGSTKFQTCQCVQPPIRFHVADRILSESTLWPPRSMSRSHGDGSPCFGLIDIPPTSL